MTTNGLEFNHLICQTYGYVCLSQNSAMETHLFNQSVRRLIKTINLIRKRLQVYTYDQILEYFPQQIYFHVSEINRYNTDLEVSHVSTPMTKLIEDYLALESSSLEETQNYFEKASEYISYINSPSLISRILDTRDYTILFEYDKQINIIDKFSKISFLLSNPLTLGNNVTTDERLFTYRFLALMHMRRMGISFSLPLTDLDSYLETIPFTYYKSPGVVEMLSFSTRTVIENITSNILSVTALSYFFSTNQDMSFASFPAAWIKIADRFDIDGDNNTTELIDSYRQLYDDYGLLKYIVDLELGNNNGSRPTCYDNSGTEPYFYFLRWLYTLGEPVDTIGLFDTTQVITNLQSILST